MFNKRVIKILKDLVAFPVLGGESNLNIAKYIENVLTGCGLDVHKVYNEQKNKVSLHCRLGPAIDGGLILSGHMDVVSVVGQPWSTDPFTLTESNGNLFGRGACDMKGFLACCLASIPSILSSELEKPLYFAFSYDEEVGCRAGPELAEAIKTSYPEKPAFAIIGEPTKMKTVTAEKGIAVLKTRVTSTAAHSSMISTEVSAIHETARLISWIEDKMEKLSASSCTDDRFIPGHTTMHVGTINGGAASNIIADQCEFCWDIRLIPGDSIQTILEEFESYCKVRQTALNTKNPLFQISTTPEFPPVPSLDTPIDSELVNIIFRIKGIGSAGSVSYASEAGQFSQAGFESVVCGPGSIEQAHKADEFIAKEELQKCMEFIRGLIKEFSY